MKSGSLNLLEPSGPVKACNGIALPLLSVLLFVVKNKDLYTANQEIHNINTRCNINLHPPVCNLTVFQKGVYFSGIKLFNHLPLNIKILSNKINSFKPALKKMKTVKGLRKRAIQWSVKERLEDLDYADDICLFAQRSSDVEEKLEIKRGNRISWIAYQINKTKGMRVNTSNTQNLV
jgi:hypothetical protein